jgi:hypothetical protein
MFSHILDERIFSVGEKQKSLALRKALVLKK